MTINLIFGLCFNVELTFSILMFLGNIVSRWGISGSPGDMNLSYGVSFK